MLNKDVCQRCCKQHNQPWDDIMGENLRPVGKMVTCMLIRSFLYVGEKDLPSDSQCRYRLEHIMSKPCK